MGATRTNRFVMMLTIEEAEQIQKYRFANCIGTKAAAARELIEEGLRKKEPRCSDTAPGGEIGVQAPGAANS